MRISTGRFRVVLGVTAIMALLLGYLVGHGVFQPADPGETTPAVGFTLPDTEGKRHRLTDWRGKVVLLNFWGTWCEPCREEIPLLIEMQRRYGNDGLQVVGIAVDNVEAVVAYRQEMGINYPLLIAPDEAIDLMADYGNRAGGLPYTVLLRPDGTQAARKLGAYSANELETLLRSELKP